jgi:hypothetical protein
MKVKGTTIPSPMELVVIVRNNGENNLVFKARAVTSDDYKKFEELCPMPNPPKRLHKDQTITVHTDDPDYLKAVQDWSEKRMAYTIIVSLSATSDLTWDEVSLSDPATWQSYQKELQESGLTVSEQNEVIGAVVVANSLDQKKIEEARKAFLAMQRQAGQ